MQTVECRGNTHRTDLLQVQKEGVAELKRRGSCLMGGGKVALCKRCSGNVRIFEKRDSSI